MLMTHNLLISTRSLCKSTCIWKQGFYRSGKTEKRVQEFVWSEKVRGNDLGSCTLQIHVIFCLQILKSRQTSLPPSTRVSVVCILFH